MVIKKRHTALSPVNLRLFPQGQHPESVAQSEPRDAAVGSV